MKCGGESYFHPINNIIIPHQLIRNNAYKEFITLNICTVKQDIWCVRLVEE